MQLKKAAKIIVVGNEKGGTGKSTISMHLAVSLLNENFHVATIDLDGRQGTLTRYIENRITYSDNHGFELKIPEHLVVTPKELADQIACKHDEDRLADEIKGLSKEYDVIIIDTPGAHSYLSRAGHWHADILITPLNDSLVDIDVLAHIDPDSFQFKEPSTYTQTVQIIQNKRQQAQKNPLEWIVLRNRLSYLNARNKEQVYQLLTELSPQLGFKFISGLGERVIYRELFLNGLTLLDMDVPEINETMSLSHVAARQEFRSLLDVIGLHPTEKQEFFIQKPSPHHHLYKVEN